MHILLIDDDITQQQLISAWISHGEHTCQAFTTQEDFLAALPNTYFDLLLVDWNLPIGSGHEIIVWVRKHLGWHVPLIVLTAVDEEKTVVTALKAGADDYVVKRVKPEELLVRINTVVRHVSPNAMQIVQLGVYEVHLLQQRFLMNGTSINLTQKEFDLSAYLFQNPDKLLSRDHLLNKIWGVDSEVDTRTVDTHISRLRKKLSLDGQLNWHLTSIYGFGYRLERVH